MSQIRAVASVSLKGLRKTIGIDIIYYLFMIQFHISNYFVASSFLSLRRHSYLVCVSKWRIDTVPTSFHSIQNTLVACSGKVLEEKCLKLRSVAGARSLQPLVHKSFNLFYNKLTYFRANCRHACDKKCLITKYLQVLYPIR